MTYIHRLFCALRRFFFDEAVIFSLHILYAVIFHSFKFPKLAALSVWERRLYSLFFWWGFQEIISALFFTSSAHPEKWQWEKPEEILAEAVELLILTNRGFISTRKLSTHLHLLGRLQWALPTSQRGKTESCFASRKINSPTSCKWFNNFLEHNEDLSTCRRAFYMLIKDRLSDWSNDWSEKPLMVL